MDDAMLDECLEDSHQGRHQAKAYRRIELITGDARRRRWTAEEKAQILAESFQPGVSVAEVARRYGMNRGLLWTWRHEARKRSAVPDQAFVPVRITEEPTARMMPATMNQDTNTEVAASGRSEEGKVGSALGSIEIELEGARVRVSGAVDAAALHQVLSYLGRRP
jgi:transposase